jgi:hypothetical protein
MALRNLLQKRSASTMTRILALSAALPASTTSMGHMVHGRGAGRKHLLLSVARLCVQRCLAMLIVPLFVHIISVRFSHETFYMMILQSGICNRYINTIAGCHE